ncbi:MAG TPA: GNAT family N-acetyltransferase [Candidatus Methanofastidiosa archaeon]|nr:GNAT family N-acetyltransferase [Candidatus Methanofastidiosa archaeon]HPR42145.1 GNAT family N-acetyltransferase [Candidatus Methanofastidiosa archaeon]
MEDFYIVDLTPENISEYGVCGYKDTAKHKELRDKIEWFRTFYEKGLRIKALISESGGYQGMIEYLPGEYAHRPVEAGQYMFIHCIFVGFKKEYKGRGYASRLIDICIQDAKDKGLKGVAVVTRKGPFMVGSEIFIKKGFRLADRAQPDFELLVRKFDDGAKDPKFILDTSSLKDDHSGGLTIMRSVQCPYTNKNVSAIVETAKREYGIRVHVVDMAGPEETQRSPCAFGTFCIVHDGEIIAHHPISNGRFQNIMKGRLGTK